MTKSVPHSSRITVTNVLHHGKKSMNKGGEGYIFRNFLKRVKEMVPLARVIRLKKGQKPPPLRPQLRQT